jgi:tRNA threonylcarbamoyladenosine modification (KEOPS) complex  Pcc1 subunit
MKYTANIIIDSNVDELYDCLKVEKINKDRSTLEIKKTEKLQIKIIAKDATALRATFDGVNKLLITFEKMLNLK